MAAILASLFFISAPQFDSEMDDQIEFSAKQSKMLKILLKGDDIIIFKNAKESSIYYKGDELWIQRKHLNRR
jgi:hypothetical protein